MYLIIKLIKQTNHHAAIVFLSIDVITSQKTFNFAYDTQINVIRSKTRENKIHFGCCVWIELEIDLCVWWKTFYRSLQSRGVARRMLNIFISVRLNNIVNICYKHRYSIPATLTQKSSSFKYYPHTKNIHIKHTKRLNHKQLKCTFSVQNLFYFFIFYFFFSKLFNTLF